jgi:hypothetical protein
MMALKMKQQTEKGLVEEQKKLDGDGTPCTEIPQAGCLTTLDDLV